VAPLKTPAVAVLKPTVSSSHRSARASPVRACPGAERTVAPPRLPRSQSFRAVPARVGHAQPGATDRHVHDAKSTLCLPLAQRRACRVPVRLSSGRQGSDPMRRGAPASRGSVRARCRCSCRRPVLRRAKRVASSTRARFGSHRRGETAEPCDRAFSPSCIHRASCLVSSRCARAACPRAASVHARRVEHGLARRYTRGDVTSWLGSTSWSWAAQPPSCSVRYEPIVACR